MADTTTPTGGGAGSQPLMGGPSAPAATDWRASGRAFSIAVRDLFIRRFPDGEQGYLLVLAVATGLMMGCVASLFRFLINTSHHLFFEAHRDPGGLMLPDTAAWRLGLQALMPAMGGLVVGFVIYRVLKLTGGHGVPSVIRAIVTGNTSLSPTMAIKSWSSIVTISSGGSCGPEGPIVEIGSVVGSSIGRLAMVSRERLSTLIGCGAAAGVSAFFNAPFGGVFLAIELLLRDFQVRTFSPIMIAAVVAHVTSEAILPHQPLFLGISEDLMGTIQPSLIQIAMFGVLGILCGMVGSLLVYAIYRTHDIFQSMRMPTWLKPALGGLGVGAVGLLFPSVLGEGYEFVNLGVLVHFRAPSPADLSLTALLSFGAFAMLKIAATSLTLGSGGTGGSFAPAMVTGAMVGAAVGVLFNAIAPTFSPSVPIFAMVGMAGVVCSALGVPLAGILIIYEIAGGDYRLVLPLMICVAASALVAANLGRGSVYTLPLLRDGFDMEAGMRRGPDPLHTTTVEQLMHPEFARIAPDADLPTMIDAFAAGHDEAFLVLDDTGHLLGMVSANDLRGVLNIGPLSGAIIAADAADPNPRVLQPSHPLSEALVIFSSSDAPAIPITAAPGSRLVVGVLHRADMLHAIARRPPAGK